MANIVKPRMSSRVRRGAGFIASWLREGVVNAEGSVTDASSRDHPLNQNLDSAARRDVQAAMDWMIQSGRNQSQLDQQRRSRRAERRQNEAAPSPGAQGGV